MRCTDADDIIRWRTRVIWVVRAIAVTLLATGAYLALKRLIFVGGADNPSLLLRTWGDDMGEGNSFARGLAMLVVGITLACTARIIATWVTPVPPDGCPKCGHTRQENAARCPECGFALTARSAVT